MAEQAMDLKNMVPRSRGLEVEKVNSADGTPIAFERSGEGPPIVVIGGALNERATFGTLAELLSKDFTIFIYDRRGRGQSGDGDQERYTADREIEDLEAVLRVAGDSCSVFANCTGGMIAILAAARGIPMVKLALYEPPYGVGDTRPKIPDDYMDRLRVLIAADRKADAIALFEKETVGLSDEFVAQLKRHPAWPSLEALAPTLVYDGIIGNDGSVPFEQLAKITIPTLVLDGGESPLWIQEACEAVARTIPDGRHRRIEGQSHILSKPVAAPILAEFFSS